MCVCTANVSLSVCLSGCVHSRVCVCVCIQVFLCVCECVCDSISLESLAEAGERV